jgi:hypothetical protein
MTAAAKITVSTAKIQNRKGDISFSFEFGRSFFLVPFQYHAAHCFAVRSVILNEVKDLSSENSGSWTLHLL